ncbi:NUDIX hydrolase [Streptomyces sp. NPDC058239]|uniref:NUDIX hydrolase n=1 Tax=unclassified Streptomyces TaxID=2593676 RepID=UPI003652150E
MASVTERVCGGPAPARLARSDQRRYAQARRRGRPHLAQEFRGHVTAGAVLADPDGRILHIRHLALNRWLLPGGHLEPQDSNLLAAAQGELSEETGIPAAVVIPAGHLPIHIDAHSIPANPAKRESEHHHFDFRFLFRKSADVVELQTEEVTAAVWRNADTIANEALRDRVLRALR